MKEKLLIPCGQESIYSAMKPYFTKHCLPSCGEHSEADANHGEAIREDSQFFVQCTVVMYK